MSDLINGAGCALETGADVNFQVKALIFYCDDTVAEIFQTLLTEQNITSVTIEQLLLDKRAFVEQRRKESVPGRIECVCEIVKANHGKIPMGIASSGIKSHVLTGLKENDMLQYFDVVVTHEEVPGRNKPLPDIFLLTAEKLKVEPKFCRGFEDADVGMESLRAAEADSEVAKRKSGALSKSAGRGSLIKSSGAGLATNLGGTA